MDERGVRTTLADGPVCVRYLYDVHGRVLLGGAPEGARVVPASALLSKAARSRFLAAAALAATAIVFEACGGADGGMGKYGNADASAATPTNPGPTGTAAPARVPAIPAVDDGGASDGGDAGDADPDAGAEDPDASP